MRFQNLYIRGLVTREGKSCYVEWLAVQRTYLVNSCTTFTMTSKIWFFSLKYRQIFKTAKIPWISTQERDSEYSVQLFVLVKLCSLGIFRRPLLAGGTLLCNWSRSIKLLSFSIVEAIHLNESNIITPAFYREYLSLVSYAKHYPFFCR